MAAYWEKAAHSAYNMKYMYLIVNSVFPLWFLEWDFFLLAPFPDHCLLVLLITIVVVRLNDDTPSNIMNTLLGGIVDVTTDIEMAQSDVTLSWPMNFCTI